MIAFKARVRDPAIASYRYRVLTPISALRSLGHAAEEFEADRSHAYRTVVFSKAYSATDQALARDLKTAGVRVVLDLCDNHFFNPRDLPQYRRAAQDLQAMIALADAVVCSTPVLAAQVQAAAGLPGRPAIAPDIYEQATTPAGPPSPIEGPARLLWFGRHASPNAPAGLEDLRLIRAPLAEAYASRPFTLTVCSDSHAAFDELAGGFPTPLRYVEWSPEALASEIAASDAALIPLSDNPFVAAKTHNRLTLALSAGLPVVADRLDSYLEFERFAYLGGWREGLASVLLRPAEARARAEPARRYLETHWSPAAVAPLWAEALGLVRVTAARAAARVGPAPSPVSAWLAEGDRARRPWLLAGPAAEPRKVAEARAEGFQVLAVGHAARRVRADAAYVTDLELMQRHGEVISAATDMVWMPETPHLDGWASTRSLRAWTAETPALGTLAQEGRLFAFPLWTARPDAPPVDFAGEEGPLQLLTDAGVRMARHLGFRAPASERAGLEAAAPFAQRLRGGLAALRRRTGLSYGPYGYPVPARIFVGADAEQTLGARILDFSVQKHATMDVTVELLDPARIPVPKDPANRSRTGFSFCRFEIPALCGYAGRGVYVDADMQVFTDITDLWTYPLDDADLLYALSHPSQGRTPQTSVMLLNCEALRWDVHEIVRGLDEGRYSYKALMRDLCIVPKDRQKPGLPYWWNSLERFDPGRTSLIHYTDMPTQPWISHANPNGGLWYAAMAEALDEGFIDPDEVSDALARGHISPNLPDWIGRPFEVDERNAAVWVAPFNRFTRGEAELEGAVRLTSDRRLAGWAWRPAHPDEPVRLVACDGDTPLLEFEAAGYAEILERHGKGTGRYAFDVAVPDELWRSNTQSLRIRALDTGGELPGSPVELVR